MKLCIDCKYCHKEKEKILFLGEIVNHKCTYASENKVYNLVTGEKYNSGNIICGKARSCEIFCGADGKWFEEK